MDTKSEIPEKQTASLGSPLMPCCASSFAWLDAKLEELHYNAIALRQSAIERGNDHRERYCLGLIDAIRTIKTEIYLHNETSPSTARKEPEL